jgi:hypothetical protein
LVRATVPADVLKWLLAIAFFAVAAWALKPDTLDDNPPEYSRMGVFAVTTVAFFLTEMGDKTQVATSSAPRSGCSWPTFPSCSPGESHRSAYRSGGSESLLRCYSLPSAFGRSCTAFPRPSPRRAELKDRPV